MIEGRTALQRIEYNRKRDSHSCGQQKAAGCTGIPMLAQRTHWRRCTNKDRKMQGKAVPDWYTDTKALQNSVKLHLTVGKVQYYCTLCSESLQQHMATICTLTTIIRMSKIAKTYFGSSFLIPDTIAVRILCDCSTKCSGSCIKTTIKDPYSAVSSQYHLLFNNKLKCPCDKKKSLPLFSSDFESVFA